MGVPVTTAGVNGLTGGSEEAGSWVKD
jgi:hypothetical protein